MGNRISMRPSINLVISEPYITVEEFCRRTGYKEGTVRQMYRENRLPIRKKEGVNGLIEINMVALTIEAAAGCEITMQA
ncbi:regulator [Pantoea agglomerans]|uniref:regulator n=1 Tax=Enterobacter agglomerans TaxID=549 RepID=UPI002045D073|nr:regulator [uncultured Pantoea sp.]DAL08737.1 MAG TPA_asm: Regulatory protein [Caudoviricetes sp.]